MTILDAIRRVVPIKYRQSIGLWMACQSSRSKLLLYPYLYVLCGTTPKNLRLLHGDDCSIRYRGVSILMPKDSIFTSWEVLQDEVYERYYRPGEGDTVVDVGAHVGMFTVKASLQVGVAGKVIAIEPAKSNVGYLLSNTEGILNITVVPVAAGSSTKESNLALSKVSPCHSLTDHPGMNTESVAVRTLDSILHELDMYRADFIKIDAEGWELEILRGARETIKQRGTHLAVAAYHNLPNGEKELPYVRDMLVSLGFGVVVTGGYVYAVN